MTQHNSYLLEIKGLKKYFPITRGILRRAAGYVRAVDGVDFFIREGETLGLVGETGCGKTTAGRTIVRLLEPTEGEIWFKSSTGEKVDLAPVKEKNLKSLKREMRIIFQDPSGSLNPRMTIKEIVAEPLIVHNIVIGVVGESGCGKSVTALSMMRLVPFPGRIVQGQILYQDNGENLDLTTLDAMGKRMRAIRGGGMAMIFQEPMSSLNPVFTIGNQIIEVIMAHQKTDKKEARERAIAMLDKVEIPGPRQTVNKYPHQLSGGMRQRAMIAMALSCNPALLIADEPTTALDVTVQAQVLDLLVELQQDFDMAIMMITHDLGVVSEMADQVVVMYLGVVVEYASAHRLFHNPLHPYLQALLKSLPSMEKERRRRLEVIKGVVPEPFAIPEGCRFTPRCQYAQGICSEEEPSLKDMGEGHLVACHFAADFIS